jgi:geranylgeranyl pyrophosphate synthase
MGAAEAAPDCFGRARALVEPGLRAAADRLNPATRQVIGYHFGWWDEQGRPLADAGGKAVRPALAVLAAEAAGGTAAGAAGAGAAVELAHNYSLLHDDIMDGDRTRRHRPTAWTVYGVPAAVLAGDALLTLATEALTTDAAAAAPLAAGGVPVLDAALLRLVDGQAADTAFERRTDVGLPECLTMAADKTGALFAAACELGARSAGAAPPRVWQLRRFGEHLGLAFQLVDDLIGIWGDPGRTGKPVLADLRAKKKSLPVVAALNAGNGAAARLAELYFRDEPLSDDELRTCAALIEETGARDWAAREAQRQRQSALTALHLATPEPAAAAELSALAHHLTTPPATGAGRLTGVPESGPAIRLPEFRIERAARCNPAVESARTHTAAWARQLGLVGPGQPWTEADLAAGDFGLLGAHEFPDAPAAALATVTDWYTGLFHLDDFLVEAYARTGDLAGAQAYLAELPRLLPVDPEAAIGAAAGGVGTAAERALADVWARTAPALSREQRNRLRAEVEDLLAGSLQELRHAVARDRLDPVRYLELKRRTNGGRIAAVLAEFARGAELPPAIATGPTVRALVDAATDSSLLLNDIFSYEREAADAAETGNMVLVLRQFLGCDAQRAVEATNELLTSRLRQFEHLADVEVPALCAAHRLSPPDTAVVTGVVDSLRDWLPGWLEWHRRAARYHPADPAQPGPGRTADRGTAPARTGSARTVAGVPSGPTGFGTATARRPLPRAALPPTPAAVPG